LSKQKILVLHVILIMPSLPTTGV